MNIYCPLCGCVLGESEEFTDEELQHLEAISQYADCVHQYVRGDVK